MVDIANIPDKVIAFDSTNKLSDNLRKRERERARERERESEVKRDGSNSLCLTTIMHVP